MDAGVVAAIHGLEASGHRVVMVEPMIWLPDAQVAMTTCPSTLSILSGSCPHDVTNLASTQAAQAPIRLARALRSAGARAGMALKPATAIEPYADMLVELDMVLLMTVEPGFGGQSFLEVVVPKIARTRELLGPDSDVWLQVDGGIDDSTVEIAAAAGANVFVAGSSVYGAADPIVAINNIRAAAIAAGG